MLTSPFKVLRFDAFTLDLARSALRRGDKELTLRRQSFDVLRYLAEHAGKVVTRDELIAAVWTAPPARPEDSLFQCIKDIRRALGNDARWIVQAVPGRGYQLMADVAVLQVVPSATSPETAPSLPSDIDKPQAESDGPEAKPSEVRKDLLFALQPLGLPTSMLVWLGIAIGLLLIGLLATLLLDRYNTERRKQAVVDIFNRTMGSPVFRPAFHALYEAERSEVLAMSAAEFDKKVGVLSDAYWMVGVCVSAGQCDPHLARKIFCEDFKTYEYAYNATHPPGQRWQTFDAPQLSVFCGCPDGHRFRGMEDRPAPPPWSGCGRKVE